VIAAVAESDINSLLYPPTPAHSIRSTDGHVDEFDTFVTALRHRWVKVEFLQAYDESDSAGYRAFLAGDYFAAGQLVQKMVKAQTEFYDHAREFNVALTRVRICEMPLSPYLLHYEIPAYEADIECGEDVRFVDHRDVEDLIVSTGVSDYVLFDEARVTALIYDEHAGIMRDVLLAEDPVVVHSYVKLSDRLIELSVPMLESPIYRDAR
jgi:hypothetical protein